MNKPRNSTILVSARIDKDLLLQVKTRGLNLNYTLNELLRRYLYIQKRDFSLTPIGSSDFDPAEFVFDCYNRE